MLQDKDIPKVLAAMRILEHLKTHPEECAAVLQEVPNFMEELKEIFDNIFSILPEEDQNFLLEAYALIPSLEEFRKSAP